MGAHEISWKTKSCWGAAGWRGASPAFPRPSVLVALADRWPREPGSAEPIQRGLGNPQLFNHPLLLQQAEVCSPPTAIWHGTRVTDAHRLPSWGGQTWWTHAQCWGGHGRSARQHFLGEEDGKKPSGSPLSCTTYI